MRLPPEYAGRADAYIDDIATTWLPALHEQGLLDAVDIFCESVGFSVVQAGRLFDAAARLGVPVKMHAEQLSNLGGSLLAATPWRAFLRPSGVRRRGGGSQRSRPRARWRCSCRWRSSAWRRSGAADRAAAPGRHRHGRRHRLQSGLGARQLAAPGDEHGDAPLRSDLRGGAGGRDPPRGARPRHAGGARHASPPATSPTSPSGTSVSRKSSATGAASIPAARSSRPAARSPDLEPRQRSRRSGCPGGWPGGGAHRPLALWRAALQIPLAGGGGGQRRQGARQRRARAALAYRAGRRPGDLHPRRGRFRVLGHQRFRSAAGRPRRPWPVTRKRTPAVQRREQHAPTDASRSCHGPASR